MPTAADVDGIVRQYLAWSRRRPVEIAFFGGNFLGIPEHRRIPYLSAAHRWIRSGDAQAIRCSTRPDTITEDTLETVIKYGVRTVEIGAQSMDDHVLDAAGRGHEAVHTRSAVHRLRKYGIGIGIQLMVGLPSEDMGSALETARQVAALKPDFVRLYPTLVFPGTGLDRLRRSGAYRCLSLEAAVECCAAMARILVAADIRIVRMGLPPIPDDRAVVGPRHPAFGHLVISRIYRDTVLANIQGRGAAPMTVRVHPRDRSRLTGLGNATLHVLSQALKGAPITVIADPTMVSGTLQIDDRPPVTTWHAELVQYQPLGLRHPQRNAASDAKASIQNL